jgi:hypothetical protein
VFHVSIRDVFRIFFILINMRKETHVGRNVEFPLLFSEVKEMCDVWTDFSKTSQYQIQCKSVKRFSNSCMQRLFFLSLIKSRRD